MFGLALWGHIAKKKTTTTTKTKPALQQGAPVKTMKMKEAQLHDLLQMDIEYSWPDARTTTLHTFTNTDALLKNIVVYIYGNEPHMMLFEKSAGP